MLYIYIEREREYIRRYIYIYMISFNSTTYMIQNVSGASTIVRGCMPLVMLTYLQPIAIVGIYIFVTLV